MGAGEMDFWTLQFWKATAERAISTGCQAVVLLIGGDVFTTSILQANLKTCLSFFLGGVFLTVLKCLAGDLISQNGPSLIGAEVVNDYQGKHSSPVTPLPYDQERA